MKKPTLASLFDGSGGFPLSAAICGIEPVWASEVEPYPIAVTRSRFPNMKHYGDVSKINGAEVEPVDVLTFGSPCQDLSVAGKRKGLKHVDNDDNETTRSGLFMEAVRIAKEMREATNGRYPNVLVWENVPGAFSSNHGEDFRTVLEELIKIVEPTAVMPAVPKGGWAYADCYIGDGWSLAYRVLDAQYIRTAQRRRRIFLVFDLTGQRAFQILFERESLRGDSPTCGAQREAVARNAADGIGADDREGVQYSNGAGGQTAACLYAAYGTKWNGNGGAYSGENFVLEQRDGIILDDQGGQQITVRDDGKSPTLRAETHGHPPCVVGVDVYNQQATGEQAHPLRAARSDADHTPRVVYGLPLGFKAESTYLYADTATTLCNGTRAGFCNGVVYDTRGNGDGCVVPTITGDHENWVTDYTAVAVYESHPQDSRVKEVGEVSPTVSVKWHKGTADTPLVCEHIYCLEGNGSRPSHRGDGYDMNCPMYTLNTIERHAVAYGIDQQGGKGGANYTCGVAPTLCSDSHGTPHAVAYGIGNGQANQTVMEEHVGALNCMHDQQAVAYTLKIRSGCAGGGKGALIQTEKSATLATNNDQYLFQAIPYRQGGFADYVENEVGTIKASGGDLGGGGSENLIVEKPQYIVRRLTPIECARLQGFPDCWGIPDTKQDFTEEEYRFWLDVRNTHAAINGKAVKEYTKEQMLRWYNKLHTDSSEYRMWGNGVALPCCQYIMEGIAEALNKEEANDNDID